MERGRISVFYVLFKTTLTVRDIFFYVNIFAGTRRDILFHSGVLVYVFGK